jgi:hypothetical protein
MKQLKAVTMIGAVLVLVSCETTSSGPDSGMGGGNAMGGGGPTGGGTPMGGGAGGGGNATMQSGFEVTITGEAFATEGIAFPAPAGTDEPFFQDGWELKFESVVAFVDKVTVSENPQMSSTDQSKTGPVVAELNGPWVVDLAKDSPLVAKEMNGKAVALGKIPNQNKKGGAAFDTTQNYAFGFDTIKAVAGATNVNGVDPAVIATMVSKGYAVWFKGTAEFKGENCRSTVADYDFKRLPKKVNFAFGLAIPTTYINCINPELMPADSRGISPKANAVVTAQATLHIDHPFWEALEEDAPLRFDLMAAQKSVATGNGPATADLTEADLVSVDFQSGKDAQGTAIPWRYCGEKADGERTMGTVQYDPKGVPVSVEGGAKGLKGLTDYMQYNTATYGHLNNDGLCFAKRNYPSPQ